MKKGLALLALVVLLANTAFAQILTPVKWTWAAEPLPLAKGKYKLVFKAKIDKGWHLYSQELKDAEDGGPIPTQITFDVKNNDIEYIGKTSEKGGKMHSGFEPLFGMNVKYFEDEMICEQIVKVSKDMLVTGSIYYMSCNDRTCTSPSEIQFNFNLKDLPKSKVEVKWETGKSAAEIEAEQKRIADSTIQAQITESMQKDSVKAVAAAIDSAQRTGRNKYGAALADCGEKKVADNQSLLSIMILGFLGGFAALLTPCVFPMIPLTVSFFTKRAESKTKGKVDALFYGFSIIFIYFLIAVPFLIFNISSDSLNEISTGAPLNVFFFLIFVVFAFSFFGFYEISLPNFIANKADSASNVGGFVGIFFMALTLAIVSFSCTGPVLGSLLVGALTSSGGKLNLVAGMTSFGFALALPFAVFAMFPNLMKSLPKSGGWLDTVKKVLGFVELIFALKFLSNADLVAHWGILKREIFLGIWALLGLGLFLFLIGKFKLPHNTPVTKLSGSRIFAAGLALLFTGYSAYGIPGNQLHLFSGFPPPMFYSLFNTQSGIETLHNKYEEALARAKAENKPVMLDFTGWACVNCRKMEENVWTDLAIKERLTEKFVVVSLYVDDKEELPEDKQRMSEFFAGKKIKTIGNLNSEMEAKYFDKNTQPYYVLITPDERLINEPVPYTPNVLEYKNFLDCGLEAYKEYSDSVKAATP